jgi:hypothetical protein
VATRAFEERAIPLELAHRRFDGRSHNGSRPPPFLPLAPRDLLLAMILPIMWCVPDALHAGGPIGLLRDKRAVLVLTRDGIHSGGPARARDYQEPHLRTLSRFSTCETELAA